LNVMNWKLLDVNGNDVTNTNEIASAASIGDQFNSIREITGKNYGWLTIEAETVGVDMLDKNIKGQATIYVLDAACASEIRVPLWGSNKIVPHPYIPEGLSGNIKFTFISSNASYATVNGDTGEIKGIKINKTIPVVITIRAEYFDGSGNPTGKVKELICNVMVEKSNIDIN
jgi:hypothetical protein